MQKFEGAPFWKTAQQTLAEGKLAFDTSMIDRFREKITTLVDAGLNSTARPQLPVAPTVRRREIMRLVANQKKSLVLYAALARLKLSFFPQEIEYAFLETPSEESQLGSAPPGVNAGSVFPRDVFSLIIKLKGVPITAVSQLLFDVHEEDESPPRTSRFAPRVRFADVEPTPPRVVVDFENVGERGRSEKPSLRRWVPDFAHFGSLSPSSGATRVEIRHGEVFTNDGYGPIAGYLKSGKFTCLVDMIKDSQLFARILFQRLFISQQVIRLFASVVYTPWLPAPLNCKNVIICDKAGQDLDSSSQKLDMDRCAALVRVDTPFQATVSPGDEKYAKECLLELVITLLELWHNSSFSSRQIPGREFDTTSFFPRLYLAQAWLEESYEMIPLAYWSSLRLCLAFKDKFDLIDFDAQRERTLTLCFPVMKELALLVREFQVE
ncbi:hypothetical protein DM02DRAFT_124873 [Periconia macrospinosa]|uniref:Uncharacterized protein n=1 Tax=Periconia macrospinosa TaxID=97972 RepID=A0A2V1DE46_9PLEO|nr:hypothetical protein DM02DRAFT_124873 [Periconia macrospinosa]